MIKDDNGRCGFLQDEIAEQLKINPQFDFTGLLLIDGKSYKNAQKMTFLDLPNIILWDEKEEIIDANKYHESLQANWFMPEEYKNLDIEDYLYSLCSTAEEKERVLQELILYKKFDLLNLLRYLKYLRDITDQNGIIMGVGRGSSCASYCLFLLKIHRINSLQYNLDIGEFLRE